MDKEKLKDLKKELKQNLKKIHSFTDEIQILEIQNRKIETEIDKINGVVKVSERMGWGSEFD